MEGAMPFDKDLAALLACPKCKGPVKLNEDESGFVCAACGLLYAIEDGIPNFLVDEAKPLTSK
jgi:uncharacterized protein YbaR (Trm112 family)